MPNEQKPIQQDPVNSLLGEFGTRLNEIEEKQRLLKDRILLIGQNLISTKEDYEKDKLEIKKQLNKIESELKSIKQLNERIINEIGNFARKQELEILERQAQMFDPLNLARIKDVKNIVNEELLKIEKRKPIKNKNS